MVLLQNNFNDFKIRGGGQQRSSSANFQKVYSCAPMHRKSILGITGSQNQVKVIKGHHVQIFKKFIFVGFAIVFQSMKKLS